MNKVKRLIAYVRLSCFDKATGFEIKKSDHLYELIEAAEKEISDRNMVFANLRRLIEERRAQRGELDE